MDAGARLNPCENTKKGWKKTEPNETEQTYPLSTRIFESGYDTISRINDVVKNVLPSLPLPISGVSIVMGIKSDSKVAVKEKDEAKKDEWKTFHG
ncbi:hypothetical protein TNIN_396271 [Trichonephila inaurata madagascariensis]|uniref:Uncharacterized protein n=1 Tax=Trichonephila inaurata madagascariensis TaxID=2747483 RepID=A0A8X6IBL4_9ARAC|nr:hypothetical protein TNIN_396271 [Trichonephila inaurata madagascariensis]